MKKIRIPQNPFLLFSPFLLLYVVFVLLLQSNGLWGDEIRHFSQVQNLLHGYYSLPTPNVELRNGPGYPFLILPLIALHVPLIFIKLLNAVLLYLSIILLYKTLIQIVSYRTTLICSLFWACYYNALDFISLLYSEVFTIFLITLLLFCLTSSFNHKKIITSKKYLYLSGFILGYIALTKIIFGYVILLMLIGTVLLWIVNRKSINYRKGFIVMIIAFITVIPYLSYTYNLTGRLFYWGTTGGNNLYWMSALSEEEYGSWFPDLAPQATNEIALKINNTDLEKGGQFNLKNRTTFTPGAEDSIRLHHQNDFEEINKFKGPARDDAYKKIVIRNIKSNPIKYIKNCISNIGRILFNYPYSYTPQKLGTLFRMPLNGIIVVFMLFSLIPTFLNWKNIIYPVRFLLIMAFIYLGGSIFGSAEIRMFTIIAPVLIFWIAFILQKSLTINFKFGGNQDLID